MPIIDTLRNLLTHNKIPTLDTLQMSDLLHHLFTTSEKTERIQVAEAVYRHDHGHPRRGCRSRSGTGSEPC